MHARHIRTWTTLLLTKNKPFVYTSKKKENVSNIENLFSDFVSRADYSDLGNAFKFQMSFLKSLDTYFGIEESEHMALTRPKIKKFFNIIS